MKNLRILLMAFILAFTAGQVSAQIMNINNFIVKENLLKNNKIAIIATDSLEHPNEKINGRFIFSLNGFKQELRFNDGIAVCPMEIEKSTFVYLKHENDKGTHGKLYYIYKKDANLTPVKISWMVMVIVPGIIILIALAFKRFIIFAIILLIVIFFFNHSNGLNLPTFFETIFDGLRSMV